MQPMWRIVAVTGWLFVVSACGGGNETDTAAAPASEATASQPSDTQAPGPNDGKVCAALTAEEVAAALGLDPTTVSVHPDRLDSDFSCEYQYDDGFNLATRLTVYMTRAPNGPFPPTATANGVERVDDLGFEAYYTYAGDASGGHADLIIKTGNVADPDSTTVTDFLWVQLGASVDSSNEGLAALRALAELALPRVNDPDSGMVIEPNDG